MVVMDLNTYKITAQFPWFLSSDYGYIPSDSNSGISGKVRVHIKWGEDSFPWILPFKSKAQDESHRIKEVMLDISPDNQKILYLRIDQFYKFKLYMSDITGRKKKFISTTNTPGKWAENSEGIYFFRDKGNLCRYDLKSDRITSVLVQNKFFYFDTTEDPEVLYFVKDIESTGGKQSIIKKTFLTSVEKTTDIYREDEGRIRWFNVLDSGKKIYIIKSVQKSAYWGDRKYYFFYYDVAKKEIFNIAEGSSYIEFIKQISPDKCLYMKDECLYEFSTIKKRNKRLFPRKKYGIL